jgi:hypothetical protein
MKSVIFLGSSNTFGVGLHTFRDDYMSIDGIKKLSWPYNQSKDDDKFIESVRWTNIVSNYLNCEEINISAAGGSPAESLYRLQNLDLTNSDYIFFEFSGIYNYFDRYFHNEEYPKTPHEIETFLTNGKNDRPELRERITNWLDNYNPEQFIDEVLLLLKNKIKELSNKKIIILFWHDYNSVNYNYINFAHPKYNWMTKYMVKFPTKKNKFNYVVHNWISENKWKICDEHPFSKYMHEDIHAGIVGNKEVAAKIINYINEKETTNSWR